MMDMMTIMEMIKDMVMMMKVGELEGLASDY
jgi:hypothetical protein